MRGEVRGGESRVRVGWKGSSVSGEDELIDWNKVRIGNNIIVSKWWY